MTEIPKPASALPWRKQREEARRPGYPTRVAYEFYTARGPFGHPCTCEQEQDADYVEWAANNALKLYEALTHPRHGDTAKMLEMAADLIDKGVGPGWESFFTPHLRRAAEDIRAALKAARGEK